MSLLSRQSDKLATTRNYRSRLRFVKIGLFFFALLLAYRLLDLQVINSEKWQIRAKKQHLGKITLAPKRGKILDRYDRELAVSVAAHSLYLRPKEFDNKNLDILIATADQELGLSEEVIREKLASKSPFVWLKRQLLRYQADQLMNLELPGIGLVEESKRIYPYADSGSVLIGKVGVDGNGLSGLEARYEKQLSPDQQKVIYYRDALGNRILNQNFNQEKVTGKNLMLTIDAEIQSFANQQLSELLKEHKAESALALLVDAENGQVISLAQAPAANFNQEKINSRQAFFNMAVQGSYEPGSTFKPLIAALAIDQGTSTLDKVYNTENGRFKIGRRTVKDVHPYDRLSLKEIIVHSSNIGMSKVAYELGREQLYAGIKSYGFGEKTGINIRGESSGILRHERGWAEIDIATHSFGQGVAVTPAQLVRAFSALVNGGTLPELNILLQTNASLVKQVIKPEVSEQIAGALQAVVTEGTGKNALIDGLIVGGKTGTAQKAKTDGRGYEQGAYIASFLGYADGSPIGINKKYVLLVMADEPRGRSIYGGTVAAPAFKKIMEYAFYSLKVREQLGKEL